MFFRMRGIGMGIEIGVGHGLDSSVELIGFYWVKNMDPCSTLIDIQSPWQSW